MSNWHPKTHTHKFATVLFVHFVYKTIKTRNGFVVAYFHFADNNANFAFSLKRILTLLEVYE